MNGPIWPPDRIATLQRLWAEGFTGTEIAKLMDGGLTRSAVLGKVHRLKLPKRLSVVPAAPKARELRQRPPRPVRPPAPPKPQMPVLARPEPKEAPVLAEPTAAHVSVMEILGWQCRFPHGDPKLPGFRFCGQPIERRSYCWYHARIVYLPVQRREKAA